MITQTDIEAAIMTWLNGLSLGGSIIWLDQNFPRPSIPYIGLRIQEIRNIHHDFIDKPDTDGVATTNGDREIVLNVETFGETSLDIINTIRNSLEKYSVNAALADNGLSFKEADNVIDLSELLDTKIEKRYRLNIVFHARNIDTDNIGLIETVEVLSEYIDLDLSTITTSLNTITIS